MARAGGSGVIETSPNPQTIKFSGKPLNLSALARQVHCSPSHMSNVFSGNSRPSLSLTRVLALELGMSIDEFVSALDQHITINKAA